MQLGQLNVLLFKLLFELSPLIHKAREFTICFIKLRSKYCQVVHRLEIIVCRAIALLGTMQHLGQFPSLRRISLSVSALTLDMLLGSEKLEQGRLLTWTFTFSLVCGKLSLSETFGSNTAGSELVESGTASTYMTIPTSSRASFTCSTPASIWIAGTHSLHADFEFSTQGSTATIKDPLLCVIRELHSSSAHKLEQLESPSQPVLI